MIGSFILFVALFSMASLGWAFFFAFDLPRLTRAQLLYVILFTLAASSLASIVLLEGLTDAGSGFDLIMSTIVFAFSFGLSLAAGYGLSKYSEISKVFPFVEKTFSSGNKAEDRFDIIDEILDRTTQTGKIDSLERELIESILKFNDKIVREVMVPRGDIVAIDIDEQPRRVLRKVIEEGYSRLPVYRGSIDNVIGVIYAKDLLTMVEDGGVIVLQDLLRSPYYVPEAKKISQLLREMQINKVHLAIVVDEFGGTEGIVTLEDVLEEIVGEIQDEYDESLSELVSDEDGEVHFSGSMTVERFNELLECSIPQGEDYDTMAGFVQKLAGKLPQKGEAYNYEEMFFTIEEVARHRIKRLRVSYKEHPSAGTRREVPAAETAQNKFEVRTAKPAEARLPNKAKAKRVPIKRKTTKPKRKTKSTSIRRARTKKR
ncbi:MAG: hemolysin family protein [Bacteroidetes bacterium]|nr:hemolysin family protein [Bacteroidota bacterium]